MYSAVRIVETRDAGRANELPGVYNRPMIPLGDVYFDLNLRGDRRYQVAGFGENAVDWVCRIPHLPQHDSKMRMEEMYRIGGGTVATASSLCSRYGLRTLYIGRVGDDEAGDFSRKDLEAETLDTVIDVIPGASSHLSLILVDRATGKRTIIWDRDEALRYRPGEVRLDKIAEAEVVILDASDAAASVEVTKAARAAGALVVLDIDKAVPEAEQLLQLVDFAIPSAGFLQDFFGAAEWREGMRRLKELAGGFAAVTLGEEGAAAFWGDRLHQFPPYPVTAVDSTSAGDVFHGAFAYSLFQGWSVGKCMRFCNAAGALACTRLGARPSIPSLEEVDGAERSDSW